MSKGNGRADRRAPRYEVQTSVETLERRALLSAGALDATFGTAGIVKGVGMTAANAIAVQSDGRILVAGGTGDFAVARYNANGTPDTSFGVVTKDLGANDIAYALAVQSDGKILVGGGSGTNLALLRLNANGTPDNAFGSGGVVRTPAPSTGAYDASFRALTLTTAGRIVAAGGNVATMIVARYLANGTPDTSFDHDGVATTTFAGGYILAEARGVAVQPDGAIVAGGEAYRDSTARDFALARYKPDGSPDLTFGSSGGQLTTAVGTLEGLSGANDFATAMTLQADGRILLGGTAANKFAVARYTPSGALDPTFGGNGIATAQVGTSTGLAANAMVVAAGGRIVLAGKAAGPAGDDVGLVRFYDDGGLDYSFGLSAGSTNRTATVLTNGGSNFNEQANALAIQSDGKILAAGDTGLFNGTGNAEIVRYDGSADPNQPPTAGAGGPYTVAEGDLVNLAPLNPADADGKIVSYEWDYDYDGQTFTADATAVTTRFSAAGLDGPATRTVALRLTDDRGARTIVTAPLTVTNAPPLVGAVGPRTVPFGSPYTLQLGAPDPGPDTIAAWRIEWGDGNVQLVDDGSTRVSHDYAAPGRYLIRATATDEDGTYTVTPGATDVGFGDAITGGTGGVAAIVDYAPGRQDVVLANLPLPDGSVLIAGTLDLDAMYLARLAPDGSRDFTFGTSGGYTPIRFGTAANPNALTQDTPTALALLTDGKILLAGTTNTGSGTATDWGLARFSADGQLDTSFGNQGRILVNVGGGSVNDDARAALALPDGRFYVAGASGGNFAVARFNADGTPDTSFDADGKQTTDMGGAGDAVNAIALQSDGRLVAAGVGSLSGKAKMALARYTPAGALDPTFDGDGKLVYAGASVAYGVALTPDRKIVAAGAAVVTQLQDFAILRLNPDGSPDPSFASAGLFVKAGGPYDETDVLRGVGVIADGSVVAGGYSTYLGVPRFALLKLTPAGTLDPAFGVNGMRTSAFFNTPNAVNFASNVSIAGDRAVVAGWSTPDPSAQVNSTVARYSLAGTTAVVTPPQPSVVNASLAFAATAGGPALTFAFDNDVAASLDPGDLDVRDRATGASVDTAGVRLAYDPYTFVATFAGLRLPDGNYRATLRADGVTDPAGNVLTADHVYDFFVLAADADHDRTVDFNDLVKLAQNYNTANKTFADGDFNYDGVVDFDDLVLLAQRYNTTLPPPPAPMSPAATRTRAAAPSAKSLFATAPRIPRPPARPVPPPPPPRKTAHP